MIIKFYDFKSIPILHVSSWTFISNIFLVRLQFGLTVGEFMISSSTSKTLQKVPNFIRFSETYWTLTVNIFAMFLALNVLIEFIIKGIRSPFLLSVSSKRWANYLYINACLDEC